jgi:hypothetical protein
MGDRVCGCRVFTWLIIRDTVSFALSREETHSMATIRTKAGPAEKDGVNADLLAFLA